VTRNGVVYFERAWEPDAVSIALIEVSRFPASRFAPIGLPKEFQSRVARVELGPDWGSAPPFSATQLACDPL
jgi:hypothetical protein